MNKEAIDSLQEAMRKILEDAIEHGLTMLTQRELQILRVTRDNILGLDINPWGLLFAYVLIDFVKALEKGGVHINLPDSVMAAILAAYAKALAKEELRDNLLTTFRQVLYTQ